MQEDSADINHIMSQLRASLTVNDVTKSVVRGIFNTD